MRHRLGSRRERAERSPATGRAAGQDDHLVAWGLRPSQWRTSGPRVPAAQESVLLWRRREEPALAAAALRARRAYDALLERGTAVRADSTERGIEVVLPLQAVIEHLPLLAEWSILPDVVLVSDSAPLAWLDRLQGQVTGVAPQVEVEIGEPLEDGWMKELRQAAGLES
ncbi:MAG TPA: hypothetical protein VFM74_06840 [Candidatus Limnocylindria bacterium]|nr:hypothetical protein [Candidatus Limnocylindria bacterium]